MNILFVSRLYPAYTGQPVSETSYALHSFVKEWVKTGNFVRVIRPYYAPHNALKFSKIKTRALTLDNVPVQVEHFWRLQISNSIYYFPLFKLLNFFRFRKILAALEKSAIKYDVVLGHMTDSFLIAAEFSRRLALPLICGVHQSYDNDAPLKLLLLRPWITSVFASASGLACRSRVIASELNALCPQYLSKLFLAESGIDKNLILPEAQYLAKAKIKKTFSFISVCVLHTKKNIHLNLEALAGLKNIDWHYTIVGDGEDRRRLEDLTDRLGLRRRVTFTGLLPAAEVTRRLRAADFYLLVSAPETFGLTYLEAMAAGLIAAGAKGQGIDGVIVDGQNGFLAKAGSAADLRRVINKMLKLTLREKKIILRNAYASVQKYTEAKQAAEYLQNIKRCIKTK